MDLNNTVALGHSKVMLLMRYIANALRSCYMLDIKHKYVSWGGDKNTRSYPSKHCYMVAS